MVLGVKTPLAVFELMAYVLVGLCAWHAARQGRRARPRLLELGAGVAFGLALEAVTIRQVHAYEYGRFLVMVGAVPLAVGVSWAVILYSGMAFAESLGLPGWTLPPLVGLLGLEIDLAMDAVAIRLGMWRWNGLSGTDQWFGVPFANFSAWFVVLSSASALLWWARPLTTQPGLRLPLASLAALPASVLVITLLDRGTVPAECCGGPEWLPVVLLVLGALAAVGGGLVAARRAGPGRSPERTVGGGVLGLVPLSFHAFFLTTLVGSGMGARLPLLVDVAIALLASSAALHGALLRHVDSGVTWPALGRRTRRSTPA